MDSHPGPVTARGDQVNTRIVDLGYQGSGVNIQVYCSSDLEHEVVYSRVPADHEANIGRQDEPGSVPGPGVQNLVISDSWL